MIRPVEPDELRRVAAALEAFGPRTLDRWLTEAHAELWVEPGPPARLHLVRLPLAQRYRRAGHAPEPLALGLFVGELEGDQVHLSLEGAYELGRRGAARRVVVTDKAAQLFLYGRDVLGESILDADPRLAPGTVALVANRHGDVLGLAEILRALPTRGRALAPLADRGWYLREGG